MRALSDSRAKMVKESPSTAEPDTEVVQPQLYSRVQHKGNRGLVRYVGPLESRGPETWVGVEWDDAGRGKHSGTAGGKSYFATSVPGAGSFVKASALGSGGRTTLIRAVTERYVTDAADRSFRDQHHVVGGADVTILAEEHARVLAALAVVDVAGRGVARLGEAAAPALRDILPCLRELRLSRSLFDSVGFPRSVLKELPNVEVLDMSRNLLGEAEGEDAQEEFGHERLRELIMNHCKTTWNAVIYVCSLTKSLAEVRLRGCQLPCEAKDLVRFASSCPGLRLVDLGATGVSWEGILAGLAGLSSLEEAYLEDNSLQDSDLFTRAREQAEQAGSPFFPALRVLGLGGNALEGWDVVAALHGVGQLTRLRVAGNPAAAERDGLTGRMQAVARVGGLRVVDGSAVDADERRHAERRYVSVVCARDAQRHGEAAAEKMHPRMRELCETFGLGLAAAAGVRGKGLRAGLVEVVMRAGSVECGRREVVRCMPRGVTMDRVRRVATMLLAVRQSNVRVGVVRADGDIAWNMDADRQIEQLALGALERVCIVVDSTSVPVK